MSWSPAETVLTGVALTFCSAFIIVLIRWLLISIKSFKINGRESFITKADIDAKEKHQEIVEGLSKLTVFVHDSIMKQSEEIKVLVLHDRDYGYRISFLEDKERKK